MTPVTYQKRGIQGLNYYWPGLAYPWIRPTIIGFPDMGLLRNGIVPAAPGNTDADNFNHEFWDIELAAPAANFYPRLNADGLRLFVGYGGNAFTGGKIEVLKKLNGKIDSKIFSYKEFLNMNLDANYISGVEIFNFSEHPGPVKFKIKVLEDFTFPI
jgi:hypothetical protein